MRLAILGSRGVPAKYGAFEIFAQRLGLGLIERGWDVTVYCPDYQEYKEPEYQGLKLRYAPHPEGAKGTLIYDAKSIADASKGDFDVLLMLGYGSSPFLRIARSRGVPTVVNTDGLEWKRSKWTWYAKAWFRYTERDVTRTADRLVSDSIGIARYYKEKYGVPSTYIAYGTELPDLAAPRVAVRGFEPDDYYIVVMRMEPENSIRMIVEGFLASKSRKKMVIVGPTTPFFDAEVKPLLAGQDRAHYLGPIYERDVVFALRRNAFAYVHGHTVGGTNPSLLEAMASANYVIARDVEFNREVVEERGSYFDSADELARMLEQVEARPIEQLRAAGLSGRERIAREFNWDHIIDEYAKVLTEAVQAKRGAKS